MKFTFSIIGLALLFSACTSSDSKPNTSDNAKTSKTEIIYDSVKPKITHDTLRTTCFHTDLSNQFDIETTITRIQNGDVYGRDSNIVMIRLFNKGLKKSFQTINFSTGLLYDLYENCEEVKSYQTKKNDTLEVVDNIFGNVVVADLNFDNKDDFAIIRDAGGNGGPVYGFYIQGSTQKFRRDAFLSDSMAYFPTTIEKKTKTLVTLVHASAVDLGKSTYKLGANGKWKGLSMSTFLTNDCMFLRERKCCRHSV